MRSPLVLALLLAACSRPNAPSVPVDDDTSGPGQDSDAPDSEGPAEQVPGWDTSPPTGLCEVVLDCGGQAIPQEPKIQCRMSVHDEDGMLWYDGFAGVEKRGRSTSGYEKAQYAVELWNEQQQEVETDILAMGRESDWVLNGACIDRALLRNQLGFQLFAAFSERRYAAETTYCTLTLDGAWRGIYFLTERPKRARSRIDLDADATGEGHAFIAKLDDSGGVVDNSSVGHGSWTLISPRQANAASGAIARSTWPSGPIRSATPRRRSAGTSGVGRRGCRA